MAMVQVGFHLGRVVLLVGAVADTRLTGSVVIRNGGRLSDFLNDVQEALRVKGDHGADSITSQMQFQVDGLTREVRQLISNTPTVIHVDSGNRVVSALIAPAAAAGVLGYGYMWWKGISFSSIMYVTKQNMANAVSSMTKHLEQVQNSLAAVKRHLTQRIQNVDDRLDKQKEISGQIRDEVTGARLKVMEIGSEVKNLKMLTSNLDGRLDSIQDKQDCQLAGVTYLLQFIEPNDGRLPDRLVQYLEPNGAKLPGRLEGLQGPVVTRSGKQGELPGLEFGLRLLALEESVHRCGGGAGLVLSTPVNAAC